MKTEKTERIAIWEQPDVTMKAIRDLIAEHITDRKVQSTLEDLVEDYGRAQAAYSEWCRDED
jgi:hypothetical protein